MAALKKKKSLLPKGITKIDGTFGIGAVVMINTQAKAVTSLSSAELRELAGKHSSQIRQALGPDRRDVAAVPGRHRLPRRKALTSRTCPVPEK